MDLQLNDRVELEPRDINSYGQGVAEVNGLVVFCDGLLPGDHAIGRIKRLKKHYACAELEFLKKASRMRRQPFCSLFDYCGGCSLQHMNYPAQLIWKRQHVVDQLIRLGNFAENRIEEITKTTIGMEHPYYYRNKSQFAVAGPSGAVEIGFFRRGSHQICDGAVCGIVSPPADIARTVLRRHMETYQIAGYDEKAHRGLVRHLLVRTTCDHRSVLVCPVLNGDVLPAMDRWMADLKQDLAEKGHALESVYVNVQKKRGNTILSTDFRHIAGEPYIYERIGDIRYRISPASFFQINTVQTAALYKEVQRLADLKASEIVLDLYCGTGAIGLQLAAHAKQVIGNDVVAPAIADAQINAKMNGIDNASFYVGPAETVIPRLYDEGIQADCVVVDPPRKGCDRELLATILEMAPSKMIYVSCNPATLARDLRILADGGFKLQAVQPV
ncbi:MAG TPA: 23S rRNA (uracil(1939)-C(5))-methyltransferase RlmD, partial [Clostridiaceae bacterium]|nr:23S rRNA (uracil(1939)-C(5))-methyltransferase RlmD [Clostridiaceae bacterium]